MTTLTIATRKSALALWQANWVKSALEARHADLKVELLPLSTKGDEILDKSLSKIGGKGLFVKELERALLHGEADIAVHSMKDVPMELPDGLCLPVICERASCEDSLLSLDKLTLLDLPKGATVGSSSLRRQSQLLRLRPDLNIQSLRGNINTRLAKLESKAFDAIVLARAGIERLHIGLSYATTLATDICMPAAGQGALGIECREGDTRVQQLIADLHHETTAQCVIAERAVVQYCQGSCQTPIAAFATIQGANITLEGMIAMADGSLIIHDKTSGANAKALGSSLGKTLCDNGGREILAHYL